MASATRTFSLANEPEVFLSSTASSAAIRRAVSAGRARQIVGRLYTGNLGDPLEQIVLRNWQRIVAAYLPGAVLVDRSAFDARPSTDGSIFLDCGPSYSGRRPQRFPGLVLKPRSGPGVLPGDMPYLEGLHVSSRGRALLDNMRPSRARSGVARTLSRTELESELARTVELRGAGSLNELRDQARQLAPALQAEAEMRELDDLIGAVLGTGTAPLATAAGRALGAGAGFDSNRVELFDLLAAELLVAPLARRKEQPDSLPALSFFEAYFSNWIEGTEFELDEAARIVFDGSVPADRVEDAHDVLGTFALVNDPVGRRQTPADAEGLLDLLRRQHAVLLERRPRARPGSFKVKPNRAGATSFVSPDLVNGTLTEGYRFWETLPEGLAKAVFMMFLVAEVHPFVDGNGRIARVMMNASLTADGQQRILIPLSYRDDYLQALRALSRTRNPRPLIRVLDYAQRYASAIDWSDLRVAERMLEETNALVSANEVEETGRRLLIPPATNG